MRRGRLARHEGQIQEIVDAMEAGALGSDKQPQGCDVVGFRQVARVIERSGHDLWWSPLKCCGCARKWAPFSLVLAADIQEKGRFQERRKLECFAIA
jgi:hypothetical protein